MSEKERENTQLCFDYFRFFPRERKKEKRDECKIADGDNRSLIGDFNFSKRDTFLSLFSKNALTLNLQD